MVRDVSGNLLRADAEALVNTVNCQGVMGKGVALQFKQAYPEMEAAYVGACRRGELEPGRVHVWETDALSGPKYVINFPTKREWFRRSRYEFIEAGLIALVEVVRSRGIRSIAVPPLGCGNGGLSWARVRPMIENAFTALPQADVLLYAPAGAPVVDRRIIRTRRPKLTRARSLLLALIDRYAVLGYTITLLEVQKLAYFLQAAGETMRLRFAKAPYGPYADNLNKVLELLEGHFIQGYDGERSPSKEISLTDTAADEAEAFLAGETEAQERLRRVGRVIEGFETPYGLELLSSVHWFVSNSCSDAPLEPHQVVCGIHDWSLRKRRLFPAQDIGVAMNHLAEQGWLPAPHGAHPNR